MDIASVLKIISYIGYILFIVFAVLTAIVFIKYDIRNVFGFLSGHVAAKRIAEMEHSSGGSGNYSQSRVKSNSLFRRNTGKNDSTNRLKTDHLVKSSNNQSTEKLDEKTSFRSDIRRKGNQQTEPLHQEKTEPLEQKTEVLHQEKTEPLSDVGGLAQSANTVLLNDSPEVSATEKLDWNSEMKSADSKESDSQTELLSESYEESFTEVLDINADTLSDFSENDIESELRKHRNIHKEVAPGFIVEKEIVLTHTSDRVPRS